MPNSADVVRRLQIVRDRQLDAKADYDDACDRHRRAQARTAQIADRLRREEAAGSSQARASIRVFMSSTFLPMGLTLDVGRKLRGDLEHSRVDEQSLQANKIRRGRTLNSRTRDLNKEKAYAEQVFNLAQ
jgi:hypothetical protein